MSDTVAVVVGAGSGHRLGAGVPKAFVDLAGRSIVERAVDGLLNCGVIDRVIAAVPAQYLDEATALLAGRATVIAGGVARSDTVQCALAALGDAAYVLIHDAARPLTPGDHIRRVVQAVHSGLPAVIPVLAVTDTIKAVDANGVVLETPARAGLRAVQTPQGFDVAVLRRAYQRYADAANSAADGDAAAITDDALLVEQLGVPVHCVDGDPLAFKITTALDMALALAMLGA